MPKQIFPAIPGYSGQVYSDDSGAPTQLNLDHLAESFRMADLLKQLGHDDASQCVRPVRMLGGFKPAALVAKLHEYASQCGGLACIVCINSERLPEFIWSYAAANGVNDLVRLKLAGGHVLGLLCFPAAGGVTAYPENGPEQELYLLILNTFARGYATNPQYLAADELLTLTGDENFETQNVETTLDRFSAWTDRNPVNVHDEFTYGNRTNEVSNAR